MKNYLLDTHVIIWMFEDNENISQNAKKLIKNPLNVCYLSAISLQEMAIKKNIGKLEFNISFEDLVNELENVGIKILNTQIQHLEELVKLKNIPNHKDPFDRMIISTAISENYSELVEIVW